MLMIQYFFTELAAGLQSMLNTLSIYNNEWDLKVNIEKTRYVMKHKCPRTRQISEVAIIFKTEGQDFKICSSNIKILSQVTCT
jgi:hypothetical protein